MLKTRTLRCTQTVILYTKTVPEKKRQNIKSKIILINLNLRTYTLLLLYYVSLSHISIVLFERRLLKILLSRSFWGDATARERAGAGAGVGAGAAAASAALATANLIRKI
jgi:hypothetical protein